MKKSFKVLLLAVMALCLAASASFADVTSYDVVITINLSDDSELTVDATQVSVDSASVTSPDKWVTTTVVNYAFTTTPDSINISFDYGATDKVFYLTLDVSVASIEIYAIVSGDNGTDLKSTGIPVPADGDSMDVYVLISGDKTALPANGGVSFDTIVKFTVYGHVSGDAGETDFESASIDVYYVLDEELTSDAVTVTETDSKTISVDVGSTVSFDVSASSSDLTSADGFTTSSDYVFVLTAPTTAGESVDVAFAFDDGEVVYTFKIVASGDSSSATTDTYVLNAGTITFTGSEGTVKTASGTTYSTVSDDATAPSWTTLSFQVSADQFASFSVTVSADSASVVAVYDDTADEVTEDALSGSVIDFGGIEGNYTVVFSSDLLVSGSTTVSGEGYFSVVLTVASKSPAAPADDLIPATADSIQPSTGTGAGGNDVIPGGYKVDTKFLSGGVLTAEIIRNFFNSAKEAELVDDTALLSALLAMGLNASDMGDSTNGYKAIAFTLPAGVTLSQGMKFFVMLTDNTTSSTRSALGIGVLSAKQAAAANGVLPIVFKLLKNPANTNNYMSFSAGNYYVGATDDTGTSSTTAQAVFVAADGSTFSIKTSSAQLLQGQTTSGTAEPYAETPSDVTDEVSSHGSSSGCDAGFGALALLAVAGALAARKVRK